MFKEGEQLNKAELTEKEKFVAERIVLWNSIVDEADIDAETKTALKKIFTNFENWEKKYNSLGDLIYYSLHQIAAATEKDSHKDAAKSLFEDLRDDIWEVFRLLNK